MSATYLLERALNLVKTRPVSPLLTMAWLQQADRAGDEAAHADALRFLMAVVPDGNLVRWWEAHVRTPEELVDLFEEALLEARMSGGTSH